MKRKHRMMLAVVSFVLVGIPNGAGGQEGQSLEVRNDSISIRLAHTELRAAIQAIGRFLSKPVLTGTLGDLRIEFFETPVPVSREQLPEILRGLVETHGLDFEEDSAFYRVVPRDAETDRRARPDARVGQEVDSATPPLRLFTVRLKHARASDVAATLNQLYGTGGMFSRPTGLSTGSLSEGLRADRANTTAERRAPLEPARPADDASLRGSVTIVPDELTNSLLIRATEEDYDVLKEGIAQLDVRPLQVLIEVIAVEARTDRQFSLGFAVDVPDYDFGDGTVGGFAGSAGLGDLAIQVMNLGRGQINAVLTAARSRGDVKILSRPVLLASNNTEAQLLVGTQQPFVQVSRSLPTDTPQRDQVVQYRDVGTKLTVRPTINQDGYVSLLVRQEISAATGETQFSAPVISTRETQTQVLVADGQTIVIGGLRDRIEDRVRTGIPILSDIPLIGGLFGSTKTRTTETELFLFITATIIADDETARAVTRERLPEGLQLPDSVMIRVEPNDKVNPDTIRVGETGGSR